MQHNNHTIHNVFEAYNMMFLQSERNSSVSRLSFVALITIKAKQIGFVPSFFPFPDLLLQELVTINTKRLTLFILFHYFSSREYKMSNKESFSTHSVSICFYFVPWKNKKQTNKTTTPKQTNKVRCFSTKKIQPYSDFSLRDISFNLSHLWVSSTRLVSQPRLKLQLK